MTFETEDHRELYVGVKRNEDGTLDFSHSARIIGDNEVPSKRKIELEDKPEKVIERLQGRLVIDEEKERRYQKYQESLIKMDEESKLKEWTVGLLNSFGVAVGQSEIELSDLNSLELVLDSQEEVQLRKQFEADFQRPYLKVDLKDFSTVYKKLTGRNGSNGCILSGGNIDQDPVAKGIGVILAPTIGPDIVHEINHTIDPYLDKRPPQDQVLEEFATYYRETFVPRVNKITTTQKDEHGNVTQSVSRRLLYESIPRICNTLQTDLYDSYAEAFPSKEDYDIKLKAIGDTITALEKYMDKPDIQKAIFNSQTHAELQILLDSYES